MPVNIDSNAVKDAEEQLQNPNSDMFRLQQQQVLKKNSVFIKLNLLMFKQLLKSPKSACEVSIIKSSLYCNGSDGLFMTLRCDK